MARRSKIPKKPTINCKGVTLRGRPCKNRLQYKNPLYPTAHCGRCIPPRHPAYKLAKAGKQSKIKKSMIADLNLELDGFDFQSEESMEVWNTGSDVVIEARGSDDEGLQGKARKVNKKWETVVGLEIHLTLKTDTKLFSGAPANFGSEPNTNITPICIGLPGTLPAVNEKAVKQAIKMGLGLGCDLHDFTFDRKNYHYPDMPKNYQITQYSHPICKDGELELPSGACIGIERAHIEEDAGKMTHSKGPGGESETIVDFNRAGNPLLEIVTRPEIHEAEDARAFVAEVQDIAQTLGASNALLEEGSIKADINISVRPYGSKTLRTRTEVKNLNSLTSIYECIEYESERQIAVYEEGGEVAQETMQWLEKGKTQAMRLKEEEDDYGYFPEPDLPNCTVDPDWVVAARKNMPEMTSSKRKRMQAMNINEEDIATLLKRGEENIIFGIADKGIDPRIAVSVMVNYASPPVSHEGAPDGRASSMPQVSKASTQESHRNIISGLSQLTKMYIRDKITPKQAGMVYADMMSTGKSCQAILKSYNGFKQTASSSVEALVDAAISANREAWDKYCAGEDKVAGIFIGVVMESTKGSADPKIITQYLKDKKSTSK